MFSKGNFFFGRDFDSRACRDCIKAPPDFFYRAWHWGYITGYNCRFSVFRNKLDYLIGCNSPEAFQVKEVSIKGKDGYAYGCARIKPYDCEFSFRVLLFQRHITDFVPFYTSHGYLSIIACHWMYWYLPTLCINRKFRPDIASKPFYVYGFKSDSFFPGKIFKSVFNLPAPLQDCSVHFPPVSILAPASSPKRTGSTDLYFCNIFKKGNFVSHPKVCKFGAGFSFSIGIFGIKRKPVFFSDPDKGFRVQPACYLNQLDAIRQAFHNG